MIVPNFLLLRIFSSRPEQNGNGPPLGLSFRLRLVPPHRKRSWNRATCDASLSPVLSGAARKAVTLHTAMNPPPLFNKKAVMI